MKNQPMQENGQQGRPTSDRTFNSVKDDKKQMGVSNSGGQRSDQTTNKDREGKQKK